MANEAALNMQFFNENINGTKNINKEYKNTIAKEDHIILGECYLNYLFSNDYMKPFIRKNYEIKPDKKKSYFDKFNIFNYKAIFNDILNKKKKNFIITAENESIKRMLNILDSNYEASNRPKFKNKFKYINSKYSDYTDYLYNIYQNKNNNSQINNKKLNSSFEQYILPKINIKKIVKKNGCNSKDKSNRNSFELTNNIFKTTNCNRNNEEKNLSIIDKKENKKISFYSPLLKKNIGHIFKRVDDRESQSVKKSRDITDGIGKITRNKFNIDSYDFEKNKYKIKYRKRDERYFLISLFKNIGKVRSSQEIEKTLFNKDENITFATLKSNLEKTGIKRIKQNLKLILD